MSLVDCPLILSAGKQDFCYYTGGPCLPSESCEGWIESSPKLVEKCKSFTKEDLELFTLMNKDAYKERKKKSRQIRKGLKHANK